MIVDLDYIIRKHMSDKDKDVPDTFEFDFANVKSFDCKCGRHYVNTADDGWIPVEKFGLPHSNEHDFRFWVTIQYTNGFRHTIKAKWDCFDKCFIHQNGKKILQDVVAYRYFSAPEPYRPERSNEHDGE